MPTLMNRRQIFPSMIGLEGTLTAVVAPKPMNSSTEEHPAARNHAAAMLFNSAICTGCKDCTPACSEANGLAPDKLLSGGIWEML